MSEFLERMRQVGAHYMAAHALLSKGPADYYFEKLVEHSEALLKLCPVQEGDRAVIIGRVPIPAGWKSTSKSLETGSEGVIVSVDWVDGDYLVEFKPDRQYYKVGDGRWAESQEKYVFPIRPDYLGRIGDGKD